MSQDAAVMLLKWHCPPISINLQAVSLNRFIKGRGREVGGGDVLEKSYEAISDVDSDNYVGWQSPWNSLPACLRKQNYVSLFKAVIRWCS